MRGTLNLAGGTLTIGPSAWIANNNPITVASGATLNVMGSIPLDAITNNGTVNFLPNPPRGRRWFVELTSRGVGEQLAAQTAASCHGPWRVSRSPALSFALPNHFLDRLGVERLLLTERV